jgi:N-acetylmuramoyl-L-alanine amidase
MHIDDSGLLKGPGIKWKKAHAFGGEMKAPRWIVLHDTAGRLDPFSSVNWFASKECKTSAHFVVERDGTITQMVPTNRRAYHAGVSHWKGVSGLNSCSIGIEIVNPGKMDDKGDAWFGPCCEPSEITKKGTPTHGQGYWLPYSEAQIQSVTALCRALVEEYPDCNEVVTHWEIAPKRKIDPCPLFPLDDLRRVVFDPTPGEVEHLPVPVVLPPSPPKEPTMTRELARSVTGKLTLGTIFTIVADWFIGLKDWVYEALGNALAVLGPAQQEAETTIAPLMSLTKTLKVNLGAISYWMLIGVLVVILYRHLRDKAELSKVKQQLPDPPNESAAASTR